MKQRLWRLLASPHITRITIKESFFHMDSGHTLSPQLQRFCWSASTLTQPDVITLVSLVNSLSVQCIYEFCFIDFKDLNQVSYTLASLLYANMLMWKKLRCESLSSVFMYTWKCPPSFFGSPSACLFLDLECVWACFLPPATAAVAAAQSD